MKQPLQTLKKVNQYFVDLQNRCLLTKREEKLWAEVAKQISFSIEESGYYDAAYLSIKDCIRHLREVIANTQNPSTIKKLEGIISNLEIEKEKIISVIANP